MTLTEEQRVKNLSIFVKKLDEVGVNTDKLIDLYGYKIKDAPLSENNNFGMAYAGSLIHKNIFSLTGFALHINEKWVEAMRLDKNQIIKMCFLSNMARSIMFRPCTERWKNDRGILWEYDELSLALRTGQRTLLMLMECGIELNNTEIECILNTDSLPDDNFTITNASTLSTTLRLANQLMWHESNTLAKLQKNTIL